MEEVIKKIIMIEMHAQEMMMDAQIEKEERGKALEADLKKLKEKLTEDAQKKIHSIREREIEEAKIESEKIIQSCAGKIDAIQKQFDLNAEIWSDDLVKKVLMR